MVTGVFEVRTNDVQRSMKGVRSDGVSVGHDLLGVQGSSPTEDIQARSSSYSL